MIRPSPLVLLLLIVHIPGEVFGGATWKWVTDKDGIRVTMREVRGRRFPTFRGAGIINTHIFQVLAVLSDIGRHKEWIYRCKTARLLRKIDDKTRVVYGRTDAPWPVADRDAVFVSKAVVNPKKREVLVKFWAVKHAARATVSGVVRMENLRGHYRLRALSETKTYVEYQVDADPGGLIPKWLAKLATRDLPINTIRNLRKQAKRTNGWYHKRIRRWIAQYYPAALEKAKQR